MKHYENLVVIKATLTDEEIKAQVESIKENIIKNGGEIVTVNEMGNKRLAYVIDKQKRGFYVDFFFKVKPAAINEIERLERLNENLLKFLTVKYESKREVAAFDLMVSKVTKKSDNNASEEEVKTEE